VGGTEILREHAGPAAHGEDEHQQQGQPDFARHAATLAKRLAKRKQPLAALGQ
jgi:hypothetical protein